MFSSAAVQAPAGAAELPPTGRSRQGQNAARPEVAIRTRAARIVDALGNAVAVEDRDLFPKCEICEGRARPRNACVRMVKTRSRDARINRECITSRRSAPPQRRGWTAVEGVSSVAIGSVSLAMVLFSPWSCSSDRHAASKRRLGTRREAFGPHACKAKVRDYCL